MKGDIIMIKMFKKVYWSIKAYKTQRDIERMMYNLVMDGLL